MNLFLIVGMTGQGKTTFILDNAIKDRKCFVYDINNEYKFLPTFSGVDIPQSRFIGDYKDFLDVVALKRESNIVFEEATGFFSGAVSRALKKLIINKRHTKNNYMFIFHSWRSVPPGIFDLVNVAVIFKTNDNPKLILSKYPSVFKAWRKVMSEKGKAREILHLIGN